MSKATTDSSVVAAASVGVTVTDNPLSAVGTDTNDDCPSSATGSHRGHEPATSDVMETSLQSGSVNMSLFKVYPAASTGLASPDRERGGGEGATSPHRAHVVIEEAQPPPDNHHRRSSATLLLAPSRASTLLVRNPDGGVGSIANVSSHPSQSSVDSQPPSTACRILTLVLCPFIFLFNFFFMDGIVPEDNFIMRLRKVAVGGLALSSLASLSTIPVIIENPQGAAGVASWVRFALVAVPSVVASWFGFVFVRCTKTCPDWLFSVVGLVTLSTRIPAVLLLTVLDEEPAIFGYLMVVLMTQLPVGVEIAGIILAVIAVVFNTLLFAEMNMERYLLIPGGATGRPRVEDVLSSSRAAFVVKVVAIILVIRQFYFLVNKAEAAVRVSQEIAEKLQKYDTDGVREILHLAGAASAQPSSSRKARAYPTLDPELHAAFEGIVKNLEKYRPHLPNYLLTEDNATSDPELDEEDAALMASATVPAAVGKTEVGAVRTGDALSSSLRGGGAAVGGPPTSPGKSFIEPIGGGGRLPVPIGAGHNNSSMTELGLSTGSMRRLTPIGDIQGGRRPSSLHRDRLASISAVEMRRSLSETPPPPTIKSRVSACVMNVRWGTGGADLSPNICNAFISIVNEVAQLTHASLHCFVGDRLIVTWNATKRCSKPESKACLFPLRVRGAVVSHGVLSKASILLTSMSVMRPSISCFAGDSKIRMFVCSSPELWSTIHLGFAALLKAPFKGLTQQSHMLMADVSVVEQAQVDVTYRGLLLLRPSHSTACADALPSAAGVSSVSAPAIGAPIGVYQLLQERSVDPSRDQEWMYALEAGRNKDNPDNAVNEAFSLYAQGKAAEGLSMIHRIDAQHPTRLDPAVLALMAAMQGDPSPISKDDTDRL